MIANYGRFQVGDCLFCLNVSPPYFIFELNRSPCNVSDLNLSNLNDRIFFWIKATSNVLKIVIWLHYKQTDIMVLIMKILSSHWICTRKKSNLQKSWQTYRLKNDQFFSLSLLPRHLLLPAHCIKLQSKNTYSLPCTFLYTYVL